MLDLLVEMAEHCNNMDKPRGRAKCSNCALNWNFSLGNHGCFLVETIDNNDKFMDDLIGMCIYHKIDYKDKVNKIADIFDT